MCNPSGTSVTKPASARVTVTLTPHKLAIGLIPVQDAAQRED
jgi:hypothetical protein